MGWVMIPADYAIPVAAYAGCTLAAATVAAFRTHKLVMRPPVRVVALWYRLHPRSTQRLVDVAVLRDRAARQARAAMTPEDFTGAGLPVADWQAFRVALNSIYREMERGQ